MSWPKPVFKFKNTKGVEYEVYFMKPHKAQGEDLHGLCIDPNENNPKIYINRGLTKKTELNTIIHEICHAFFWDKSEREVTKFANTVTAILYKQGWRKEKDD